MSDVTLKGGDLLTANSTQCNWCEELGLKFNIDQLCVDGKLKGTASYLDDIKYANIKVRDLGGKLQNGNGKTEHTFCNSKYTFYQS
jgi:hypothetical protein